MSFHTKLIALLKTDSRFVDDEGELVLAAVQDRAWKIDHALAKLLLSDKESKSKFFDEIEGHWIFNINTFIDDISQKNFLDNPCTRFRNRIGLTVGENGLKKQKRLLAQLLDKNQLYVNLSEIDDSQFKVSREDKALNRAFYGEPL